MSDIHNAIWLELRDRITAILPAGFSLQDYDLLYYIGIVGPAGDQAQICGIQILTGSHSVIVEYTAHILLWKFDQLQRGHLTCEYAEPNCLQAIVDRTALLIHDWQMAQQTVNIWHIMASI